MPRSARTRPPAQARSRDTEARILAALRELLEERALDEVSVQEVAARAGVSVGGFYARFASKDHAMAHLLYEGYVAQTVAEAGRVLDPARWEGEPIARVARAYFGLIVETARQHLPVIRELVRRSREAPDEMERNEAWARFREHVHAPFRRLLEARADEITHPDPALAISFAFSACSSALRETVLFGHMQPSMGPIADDVLAAELSRMLCSYLGAPYPG